MNFTDFYKPGTCRYSFEVFPVKTEEGVKNLLQVLGELKDFDPAYVSVTYGALGSTRDLTRDLALRIHRGTKIPTAFHFTCVGSGRQEIKNYVEKLKKEGLNLVVALRGDPPKGGAFIPPTDGFRYANELVTYLKSINGFSMAVAGYPEGHPEAGSKEADLVNLKRKVEAGADAVITQMFFDNRDYFDFVERAHKVGISVPIIPGIMPILNLKQIEKITGLCGAKIPSQLHQRLVQCGEDVEATRNVGIEHALKQCHELKKSGVPGIHFYTLNKSLSVAGIIENL
ncbi:MAG TPA: methylenetetrahydrofolate reductase [NAD(P)H] [Deltaproteobacteria bacterium]|nr:MAG: methylenetetrahydrofolate reductase [NAD(P)H] [Deltaproteobacteria bacterium GWA2_45_12]HBF12353.1 methylenetetrahydrofolate reductase [NAD(P)H] [Deltaproteobacteria bacterium]